MIRHKAVLLEEDPSSHNFFDHLPSVATASLPAAAAGNEGSIVYDTTTNTVKFSDGSSWANIGVAGSAGSLDTSYDFGGAGAGRTITADSGALAVTVSNASNNAALVLTQNDTTNNPEVLTITNAGSGNDITATNWSVSKDGALTATSINSAGISDSGTAALTTLTATTATITTLNTSTIYQTAIASAADGNVALTVDAAGSGTIGIGTVSTGAITLGAAVTVATGKSVTLDNGNLTLSAGTVSITAGAGDGDCLDLVPIVTQAGIDLNLATGYNLATGAVDIDTIGTGTGPVIAVNHASTYTGNVLAIDQTTAVGSVAIALTGAGTRTVSLVSVTDTPSTSATFDLNVTPAGAAAGANVFDIDIAGTGSANVVTVNFAAAYTGDAVNIDMTNAVAGSAVSLTGAGTRTVPLFEITDVPTTSAPTFDINITPGAGVQAGLDIDVAGTQAADVIAIDFSAAFTGDALNITTTNMGAGGQAIVVDGSIANSGAIVSLSTSGISTANGSVLTATSSTQPGAANVGVVGRFLETGNAQATTYAVQIDSTNNEALNVSTGKAHFAEAATFLASNCLAVVGNYVQAGGSNNAITVAAIADDTGTTIPLADGLVLTIDLNTRTLQAGANTLDYAGGGAVSITRSTSAASNLGTAFAANGVIQVVYSAGATAWLCLSQ